MIAESGEFDPNIMLQAAHMAATAGSPLTVALLFTPPWSIAFEPAAAFLFNDDELEFSVLMLLTGALESVSVEWRLESVMSTPESTIVQLAGRYRTPLLAAAGRRRWGVWRRPARIARSVGLICGLPVVLL
ncbi:hypothetical protein ACFLIM_36045 [Nonomuraea sp. M3C6]|uniref:Uncharacterized protein n=1 Tax=Nonomuraea marmarensis TaxID=3351344 RepID=A0ABW7AML2_9ACTN